MELELPTPGGPPEQAGPPRGHTLELPDGIELPEGTLLEIPLLGVEHAIDLGAPGVPATEATPTPAAAPALSPAATDGGEAALHRWLRVFWPTDGAWYEAHIREYRPTDRRHRLWYKADGAGEWLDLAREDAARRLQWLPGEDESTWPPVPRAPHPPFEQRVDRTLMLPATPQQEGKGPKPLMTRAPPVQSAPPLEEAVGWRIGVYWPDDQCFYFALVIAVESRPATNADPGDNPTPHLHVHYEDGVREWVNPAVDRVQWVEHRGLEGLVVAEPEPQAAAAEVPPPQAEAPAQEQAAAQEPAATVQAVPAEAVPAPPAASGEVPSQVAVVCGPMRGVFDVAGGFCILAGSSKRVTPTEFERLGGKGSSKKWKVSIRVDDGMGNPGLTLSDWFVEMGLDAPSAQKPTRAAAPASRSTGRSTSHPPTCTCVICKQARRAAAAQSHPGAQGDAARGQSYGFVVFPRQLDPGQERHRLPQFNYVPANDSRKRDQSLFVPVVPDPLVHRGYRHPRWGKPAFVYMQPQFVKGPARNCMAPGAVASTAWEPHDWALKQGLPSTVALDSIDGPGVGPDATRHAKAHRMAIARRRTAAVAALPAPPEPRRVRPAPSDRGSDDDSSGDELDAMGGVVVSRAAPAQLPMTIADKVRRCAATEKDRVMFGKSGIHGWGLIARKDMPKDSMVLEYRAQVVRRSVADKRERTYGLQGIECYFFGVSEDTVMDSTYCGSLARFTNHCCMPSMYTRVIEMAPGDLRLLWFARTDIKAGQELTYNYRFNEEEGEKKVPCQCGAPNCRGFLN